MSSPLSNLKKSKKYPLNSGAKNNVPYRYGNNPLMEEVTTRMVQQKGGITKSEQPVGVPTDLDLMQTMISRIALLEHRVQLQNKEISDKDKRVQILEDKVRLYQKLNDETAHSPSYVRDLETKCLLLQQQISDMEEFLMDYGMIWAGGKVDNDSVDNDSIDNENNTLWNPVSSVVDQSATQPGLVSEDYDRILQNVQELNLLAGDGETKIEKTAGGARFKVADPVQLILYANGIVLFDGPFRPFTDESTQICIKDIMDGYFPSELQAKYPDGVPFKVVDKRNVIFEQKNHLNIFSGTGYALGGEQQPSHLVPSALRQSVNSEKGKVIENTVPGIKLTADQFLSQMPSSVIKAGKVIDIRKSLIGTLENQENQNESMCPVTVVQTETIQELKNRLEIDESIRPPSGKNITTLRIKDIDNHVYVLKMKFTDTISDVMSYLDELRRKSTGKYCLVTSLPNKSYTDLTETLFNAGLTPNATMHIKLQK